MKRYLYIAFIGVIGLVSIPTIYDHPNTDRTEAFLATAAIIISLLTSNVTAISNTRKEKKLEKEVHDHGKETTSQENTSASDQASEK